MRHTDPQEAGCNRRRWTAADVLRQSRQWVSPWYPPNARHAVVGDYELYIQEADATLMTDHGVRPERCSMLGALEAAHQCGADTLTVTLGVEPPGEETTSTDLAEFGNAEQTKTTDVLALELDGIDPAKLEIPHDVRVDSVGTLEQFGDYERTSAQAWGYPEPTDEDIRAGFEELTPGWFIAYRSGTPVATGGYSLVGAVARLWGAAVVPEARGRGAYRALVATRLRHAIDQGATLALTHAEQTSSPILQRLGFRKYGEQRTFRFSAIGPRDGVTTASAVEATPRSNVTSEATPTSSSTHQVDLQEGGVGQPGICARSHHVQWPSALAVGAYGDLVRYATDEDLPVTVCNWPSSSGIRGTLA